MSDGTRCPPNFFQWQRKVGAFSAPIFGNREGFLSVYTGGISLQFFNHLVLQATYTLILEHYIPPPPHRLTLQNLFLPLLIYITECVRGAPSPLVFLPW